MARIQRTTRMLLATLAAAALLLALPATGWAQDRDGGMLEEKLPNRTLRLDEGIHVVIHDGTRILDGDGNRISFAGIPTPEEAAPALVRIEWSGVLSGNRVKASLVLVEKILE